MRVAQIVLSDASQYERKCQRIDLEGLSTDHEVAVIEPDQSGKTTPLSVEADVAHVYGKNLPSQLFRGFSTPYIAPAAIRRGKFAVTKPVQPRVVVSPLDNLPEAVEESYFKEHRSSLETSSKIVIRRMGTFGVHRAGVTSMIERTLVRIHRFRNDITWSVFDRAPSAADLIGVDLWIDPATADDDFDGFVAEALVTGTQVVATRTPVNVARLEKGHTGFLVPVNDPNEMTHAILTALFKPEVAEQKDNAARQTVSKFRSRRRLRVLMDLYRTLIA